MAAVLHLGNLDFKDQGETCSPADERTVNRVAMLLETSPGTVVEALTHRCGVRLGRGGRC